MFEELIYLYKLYVIVVKNVTNKSQLVIKSVSKNM